MMEIKGEELEVVSAGTVAGAATGDDVGRRTSEVESLASVASELLGEELLEERDPLEEVRRSQSGRQNILGWIHLKSTTNQGKLSGKIPPDTSRKHSQNCFHMGLEIIMVTMTV